MLQRQIISSVYHGVTTAMTTMKTLPSTAETAKQLKTLLKALKEERADAVRLDDLRRLFAQHVTCHLHHDPASASKMESLSVDPSRYLRVATHGANGAKD